jgi:serine/threonine protein kinase
MEAVHYNIGAYQYRTDRVEDILGKGSFGNVYKGKDIHGNFVAIKIIPNSRLEDIKTEELMTNEINILKTVKHPNVLSLITEIKDNDNLYLITECCDYDLRAFIGEKVPNEGTCVKILKDVVKGYEYLHNVYKIAHRDIKLENILIKMVSGEYVAKIADYGFARFIETKTTLTDCLMNSYLGSQIYMAPEIATCKYNYTVDIYYYMLFHYFPNVTHLPNVTDPGIYTIDLSNTIITNNSYSFIEKCIKIEASRMHLDGVLHHPLIHDAFVEDDYHEMKAYVLSLN